MTRDIRQKMLEAAQTALANSHSPYSGFRVGAAVLTSTGKVFGGCNVENASFPVSLCAERGAIATAVAAGEKRLEAVLIVTDSPTPCPPCGMCRQALAEFGADMEVVLVAGDGQAKEYSLADLLPEFFGPDFLNGTGGRP